MQPLANTPQEISDLTRRAAEQLSQGWTSGSPRDVIEILSQFSLLAKHPQSVLQLIALDISLRAERCHPIDVSDYGDLLRESPPLKEQVEQLISQSLLPADRRGPLSSQSAPTTGPSPASNDTRESQELGELETEVREGESQTLPYDEDSMRTSGIQSPDPRLANAAATQLGRYQIQKELASGTFGSVYLAHDSELRRDVAVKRPRRQAASESEIQEFRCEAQKLAALSHPHLVAVFDFGVDDAKRPYLVTEYLAGQTLRHRLNLHEIDRRAATLVAQQVCEALHCAHRQGFVHRDVKPENVIFDSEGRPRLGDFGLALWEDEQADRRGEVAGTPAYMAPEQVAGLSHHLDGRADIWAIGVILYQIWSGKLPFRARTAPDLYEQIRERPVKPLPMVADGVPPEINAIVMKCLEKLPENRFASADDVATALSEWLRSSNEAQNAAPSAVTSPAPRTASLSIAALALLAIVTAIGGGWLLFGRQRDSDRFGEAMPANRRQSQSPSEVDDAGSPAPRWRGDIEVVVWNAEQQERSGIHLNRAFPLQESDAVRIDVALEPPAYVYLFWISSDGVVPLYPWTPGEWDSLPGELRKTDRVSLPENRNEGWPLSFSNSMETILMVAGSQPLHDRDWAGLLSRYPVPQQAASNRVIRLDDSAPEFRSPNLQATPLGDDVQAARQFLESQVGGRGVLMRAIGFLHSPPPKTTAPSEN